MNKPRKKNQRQITQYLPAFFAGVVVGALAFFIISTLSHHFGVNVATSIPVKQVSKPEIKEMLLTPNAYSRPQTELSKVKGIVIHYVANPGTSAKANRDYFEQLKDGKTTSASSHFVIGLKGEIVQCVPLNEVAYASNNRNNDTISIECCHEDESGKFNKRTYQSLIQLVAWLSGQYNVNNEEIIRHYDVTKKMCPKYYVEHPKAWKTLKKDINEYIETNGK